MRKPLETSIARYKREHGLTYAQLAKVFDTEATYLRKLGCGMCRPGPGLAEKIERLSGGEIKREELVFPKAAA